MAKAPHAQEDTAPTPASTSAPTVVLGLDLASVTGWCLMVDGTRMGGTWDMSLKRTESAGFRPIKLRSHLNQVLEAYPALSFVTWEEIQFAKHQMAHAVHHQLLSALLVWCEDHKIQYSPTPVGTIKKHATGKGNAPKEKMLAAAEARWPNHAFRDHNEADAWWVLDVKVTELGLDASNVHI